MLLPSFYSPNYLSYWLLCSGSYSSHPTVRKLLRNFHLYFFATFLCPSSYGSVLYAVPTQPGVHILQVAMFSPLMQSVPLRSLLSQDVLLVTGLSSCSSFAALLRTPSSYLVFQVTTCPEIKATFQRLK